MASRQELQVQQADPIGFVVRAPRVVAKHTRLAGHRFRSLVEENPIAESL